MRILYIADLNSPFTRRWVDYFSGRGAEVQVVSLNPLLPHTQSAQAVPLLFSQAFTLSTAFTGAAARDPTNTRSARPGLARLARWLNARLNLLGLWAGWLAPLDLGRVRRQVQQIADAFRPDLVHAMRLPLEAELAADLQGYPLAVSIWGNDLTLYAARYPLQRRLARRALSIAAGLHTDCQRDVRLAGELGFDRHKPTLVIPTGGGIETGQPVDQTRAAAWRERLNLPPNARLVINPRGLRPYLRTEEYLRALPAVLAAHPETIFVSVAAQGSAMVEQRLAQLGLQNAVRLLPHLPQPDLLALLSLCDVMASPSTHDGTPNTLLEAMQAGVFPVCGDLESIREWITGGENGLLCDPRDPQSIAAALISALSEDDRRARAAAANRTLMRARADFSTCMAQAESFYRYLLPGVPRLN